MNILVLGSGGREHTFAYQLAKSERCKNIFVAPGNAGTAAIATNVALSVTDFAAIEKCVVENHINMVIVGPEDPLVKGITNYFAETPSLKKVQIIGPSKRGALLEGSKERAKEFMVAHNIPTAAYASFTKARLEAMLSGKFGDASTTVVIEEFLDGIELSVFVLTDGKNYKVLPTAKDYKRIGEGDKGLNTGGMGAISPVPFADKVLMQKIEERIVKPTVNGLKEEKIDYKGFVFIGIIKVGDEPYVIEYNVRMGDPETEVVLPRIKTDFVDLMEATYEQNLDIMPIEIDERSAATIMLVSGGYPEAYDKGKKITGIENVSDSIVFHAGTKLEGNDVLTNGGRVIAVTSLDADYKNAIKKSYQNCEKITFDRMYYRTDIGFDL